MPARILVADDHEVVRQGIRAILQARPDWDICGEAVDGRDAIRLAKELHPDVIIMDITMPVMSGLEASQEIVKLQLPSRILIFTMHESKSLGPSVRKVGAHGYVVKSRAGPSSTMRHLLARRRMTPHIATIFFARPSASPDLVSKEKPR
jgi:DNA-binding NarL/FixJ family response regulator